MLSQRCIRGMIPGIALFTFSMSILRRFHVKQRRGKDDDADETEIGEKETEKRGRIKERDNNYCQSYTQYCVTHLSQIIHIFDLNKVRKVLFGSSLNTSDKSKSDRSRTGFVWSTFLSFNMSGLTTGMSTPHVSQMSEVEEERLREMQRIFGFQHEASHPGSISRAASQR